MFGMFGMCGLCFMWDVWWFLDFFLLFLLYLLANAINMFFHEENYYKVRLRLVADLADFNKSLENSS